MTSERARARTTGHAPPDLLPAQVAALVASGAGIIVDVREGYERREARIPGSVHVPLGELLDRLNELPSGKTRILQCHSGARSRMAADALAEMGNGDGFANLAGGIVAWARAGQPIEA